MATNQRKLLWAKYCRLEDEYRNISWKCETLDMDYAAAKEVSESSPSEEMDMTLAGIRSDLRESETLKENNWLELCMKKYTLKTQYKVSEKSFVFENKIHY